MGQAGGGVGVVGVRDRDEVLDEAAGLALGGGTAAVDLLEDVGTCGVF
jgi:hypothetical protein